MRSHCKARNSLSHHVVSSHIPLTPWVTHNLQIPRLPTSSEMIYPPQSPFHFHSYVIPTHPHPTSPWFNQAQQLNPQTESPLLPSSNPHYSQPNPPRKMHTYLAPFSSPAQHRPWYFSLPDSSSSVTSSSQTSWYTLNFCLLASRTACRVAPYTSWSCM